MLVMVLVSLPSRCAGCSRMPTIPMQAYFQVSQDLDWLKKHYSIMTQWASYLITDGLIPAEQLSTDDFAGTLANQTDLAIKAIVGIGAMGEIAAQTGHKINATYYRDVSREYIEKWIELAISKDGGHAKLAYQDDASWGTLYNLYGVRDVQHSAKADSDILHRCRTGSSTLTSSRTRSMTCNRPSTSPSPTSTVCPLTAATPCVVPPS